MKLSKGVTNYTSIREHARASIWPMHGPCWAIARLATAIAFVAGLGAVGPAAADIHKRYDMDVLPSADPDIDYYACCGSSEGSVFSVTGGFLHQTACGRRDNPAYFGGGTIAADERAAMTARVAVNQICDGAPGQDYQVFPTGFGFADGQHAYRLFFWSDGIVIQTAAGNVYFTCDIADFHVYRIEKLISPSRIRVSVDGALIHEDDAPASSGNYFQLVAGIWGDNSQGDATWDFLEFRQPWPPQAPGDLDCDGDVDSFDIGPFVLALTDASAYLVAHPDCNITNADVNADSEVDVFDIAGFIDLLAGG